MEKKKKTVKSSVKSETAKSKSAKSSAKKPAKLDLDTFTVSQTELATIIGLATANITPMLQNGMMVKDADGRFNLRDSVSGYVRRMRERKDGAQSKSSLETETAFWKLQNIKMKNRDWRMQRDRMVGQEILNRLGSAMGEFREKAKLNPGLVELIDEMIGRIESISVDDVSAVVEGGDEEDDE